MPSSRRGCARCPSSTIGCTSASRPARPANREGSMATERVDLRPLEPADVGALESLAHTVWHAHYPGIITSAQIGYMLAQRYRPEVVLEELRRSDVWWELATLDKQPVGFSSCLLTAEPGE